MKLCKRCQQPMGENDHHQLYCNSCLEELKAKDEAKTMKKLEPLRLMKWAKKPMKRLPDDLEANYLAGLIDGEGSIVLYRRIRKDTKKVQFVPIVVIAMNSPVLKELWKLYGGSLTQSPPYKLPTVNYSYHWSLMNRKILKPMMERILPFLREKKKQAKLLLQALETRDKEELEKLTRRISRLNRRYYGPDSMFYPEEK